MARPIRARRPGVAGVIAVLVVVASACAETTSVVAPNHSTRPSSMPTEAQSPSGAAAPSIDLPAALVDTKIVFYRDKGSPPRAFMIDPDVSNEIPMSPH